MRRYLAAHVRRMKFRIRVGAVPVPRASRAKHHRASFHRALVHLTQVHSREMDLKRALITEGLEADVALHPLFAGGGVDELHSEAERPGRRQRLAAFRPVLGRALLIAPVVVAAAEASAEFSEVEVGRGLAHARHHKIVQTGR